MAEARHAIAHFLIERDEGESHIYLADGTQLQLYAVGSAALLRCARLLLDSLRAFCSQYNLQFGPSRGMILPMPENRNQFIVRAQDYGLE